jgi:deoxyribodipyrimidine photo-lyase
MNTARTIVWLRQDLRVTDHPALSAAIERGGPVIPVYIRSPEEEGEWAPGGASRWWLHQSLGGLGKDLKSFGSRLTIRKGESLAILKELLQDAKADAVYWNRRYEPAAIERDKRIKAELQRQGVEVQSFNGSLLFEPREVQTSSGTPFQVFTRFWKACLASRDPREPLGAPKRLPGPRQWPKSLKLDDLGLQPAIDWADGIRRAWKPGTAGAMELLARFVADKLGRYGDDRNRPDVEGTSRLSPHLHFGEISPHQVYHAVKSRLSALRAKTAIQSVQTYLTELGWREFAHHLLYHFPHTTTAPLRPKFAKFPWHDDDKFLRAWQKGQTGYPLVDAGMRELWTTGWMHNRVRMVVASFLVKHLLIPWQRGVEWFWDTLVDADLANNTLGWQWTAGCGADAAPFFRIFNPVTQGTKFDPTGDYVRYWVPELANLPDKWIHCPFDAPEQVLADTGVRLGKDYPRPVVVHSKARQHALAAFEKIKST